MTCLQKHRHEKTHRPFEQWVGVRGLEVELQAELLEDTCALDIVQGFCDEVRPSYVWATTLLLVHVCFKDDLLAGIVVESVTVHDVVDVAKNPLLLFGGELHAGAGCDVEQYGVCIHNDDQGIRTGNDVKGFFWKSFRLRRLVDSLVLLKYLCEIQSGWMLNLFK